MHDIFSWWKDKNIVTRHSYGCRNVSIFDVMYMYLNTPYIDNNTVIYVILLNMFDNSRDIHSIIPVIFIR